MTRKRVAGSGGEAEPKRTRSNRDAAEHDNKPGPGSLVKASDDARPDALEALELQQAADASKAGAPASVGDAAPQRGPDTPVADEEVPVRRSAAHARARRRAAHFAYYVDTDAPADEANVHIGGDAARDLGPFSSAYQMVQGRAAALAARSEKILDDGKKASSEPEEPRWVPSRKPGSARPAAQVEVAPLSDICTDLLATYVEDIESLWGLPDAIKVRLAAAVGRQRRMTPEAVRLFTEGAPSEVVLPDCTALLPAPFAAALKDCATPRLERLELMYCGRPFGDEAAAALSEAALPGLRILALGGAYRLSDGSLTRMLRAAPHLVELRLPQASKLAGDAIELLPKLAPRLEVLDLNECRGVGADSLTYALTGLKHLRSLNLAGMGEVGDVLLTEAALALPLREITLSRCAAVGDPGVAALAAGNPGLEVLRVDHCGKVSDVAMLAVAESCRRLRVLSVRECVRISDEALAAVAENGALEELDCSLVPAVATATAVALTAYCKDRLEVLDVSFCREWGDELLGLVADGCRRLRTTSCFGCSRAGRTFLDGHSNEILVVSGLAAVSMAC